MKRNEKASSVKRPVRECDLTAIMIELLRKALVLEGDGGRLRSKTKEGLRPHTHTSTT